MTKVAQPVKSKSNGTTQVPADGSELVNQAKEIIASAVSKEETQEPVPVQKDMTLQDKINKIEMLQLLVEKRNRLVQTRSELERFQTSSNDFNCSMRLNDSDGNVFSNSFTPGIKKVIEFLKSSFDSSINEVEQLIKF